jgi:hypothetical protein
MNEPKTPGLTHRSAESRQSSRFGDDFKRDAVRLVVDEKYTFPAAAKAVGVSVQSLRASLPRRSIRAATTPPWTSYATRISDYAGSFGEPNWNAKS